jgi:hypothetical protein
MPIDRFLVEDEIASYRIENLEPQRGRHIIVEHGDRELTVTFQVPSPSHPGVGAVTESKCMLNAAAGQEARDDVRYRQ